MLEKLLQKKEACELKIIQIEAKIDLLTEKEYNEDEKLFCEWMNNKELLLYLKEKINKHKNSFSKN
jgi:hypothetical protein